MTDQRLVESWTWFAVATVVVLLRYVSRAMRLGGVRYYQLEDYIMIPTYGFYTNIIVWVNIQQHHPRTNILPPTGLKGMSDAEIRDRTYGTKITFTIEESMVMLQFLSKVCMCLLYYKLTDGLGTQFRVKLLLGYVVLGWLITEIFFFGVWCRPFLNYFHVFEGNSPGCTTSQNHLIMSFAFNISSDVLMLLVPIPLLLQSRMPWKQKATVTGVFSFGVFVVIAATLSRYYCFAKPESILWIFWYVREASTVVIVANIPHLYALVRNFFKIEAFGSFGSFIKRSAKRSGQGKYPLPSYELKEMDDSGKTGTSEGRTESTERIAPPQHQTTPSLQIWQRNEYCVKGSSVAEEQWSEAEQKAIWKGAIGTRSIIMASPSGSNV